MTNEELQAIRERCEAATPGPWDNTSATFGVPCKTVGIDSWPRHIIANCSRATVEDATFIAQAREDIPVLLAEVERLRTLLQRVLASDFDAHDRHDLRQAIAEALE